MSCIKSIHFKINPAIASAESGQRIHRTAVTKYDSEHGSEWLWRRCSDRVSKGDETGMSQDILCDIRDDNHSSDSEDDALYDPPPLAERVGLSQTAENFERSNFTCADMPTIYPGKDGNQWREID